MRSLLVLLVVALGALGVAEVLLPPTIEREVARRVERAGFDQHDVEVELPGFPVVARVVATGEIERVVVRLAGVSTGGLTFASVVADVRGTVVARSALLDGEVSFESVEEVRLSATLAAEEITRLLPVGVTDLVLSPGEVSVAVAGQRLTAAVTAAGGVLTVDPEGPGAFEVPLPRGDVFPCALGGEVADGEVRVSCTLDEVPPWLLDQATVELTG